MIYRYSLVGFPLYAFKLSSERNQISPISTLHRLCVIVFIYVYLIFSIWILSLRWLIEAAHCMERIWADVLWQIHYYYYYHRRHHSPNIILLGFTWPELVYSGCGCPQMPFIQQSFTAIAADPINERWNRRSLTVPWQQRQTTNTITNSNSVHTDETTRSYYVLFRANPLYRWTSWRNDFNSSKSDVPDKLP